MRPEEGSRRYPRSKTPRPRYFSPLVPVLVSSTCQLLWMVLVRRMDARAERSREDPPGTAIVTLGSPSVRRSQNAAGSWVPFLGLVFDRRARQTQLFDERDSRLLQLRDSRAASHRGNCGWEWSGWRTH